VEAKKGTTGDRGQIARQKGNDSSDVLVEDLSKGAEIIEQEIIESAVKDERERDGRSLRHGAKSRGSMVSYVSSVLCSP